MYRIIGFLVLVAGLFLASCQSESVDIPSDDEALMEKAAQITLDETVVESTTTEAVYEVEFYANAEQWLHHWWNIGKRWGWTKNLRYHKNHCPEVQLLTEPGEYPKIVKLDYGEETILKNGKVLSGVIEIEITDHRKNSDYSRYVRYTDFGVDTVVVNGIDTVDVSKDDERYRMYKSELTITFTNNDRIIDRVANRTWLWIEGEESEEDQSDDILQITGMVTADEEGTTYVKEIIDPLIRIRDCKYIVSGVVQVSLNGDVVSTLDYGDGECDSIAMLTVGTDDPVEVDLSENMKKNMNKWRAKKMKQNKGNQNGKNNQSGNGNQNGQN